MVHFKKVFCAYVQVFLLRPLKSKGLWTINVTGAKARILQNENERILSLSKTVGLECPWAELEFWNLRLYVHNSQNLAYLMSNVVYNANYSAQQCVVFKDSQEKNVKFESFGLLCLVIIFLLLPAFLSLSFSRFLPTISRPPKTGSRVRLH